MSWRMPLLLLFMVHVVPTVSFWLLLNRARRARCHWTIRVRWPLKICRITLKWWILPNTLSGVVGLITIKNRINIRGVTSLIRIVIIWFLTEQKILMPGGTLKKAGLVVAGMHLRFLQRIGLIWLHKPVLPMNIRWAPVVVRIKYKVMLLSAIWIMRVPWKVSLTLVIQPKSAWILIRPNGSRWAWMSTVLSVNSNMVLRLRL